MIKNIKEITQEELDLMAKHHKMYEYDNASLNELLNLIRIWVNPNVSNCTTCNNNLRDYKQQLNSLYLAHKDTMKQILEEKNNPEQELDKQALNQIQLLDDIKKSKEEIVKSSKSNKNGKEKNK